MTRGRRPYLDRHSRCSSGTYRRRSVIASPWLWTKMLSSTRMPRALANLPLAYPLLMRQLRNNSRQLTAPAIDMAGRVDITPWVAMGRP